MFQAHTSQLCLYLSPVAIMLYLCSVKNGIRTVVCIAKTINNRACAEVYRASA